MRELPILFSTPMVQAILAGRKTQTRRIRTNAQAGDLLWVRETWKRTHTGEYIYKASLTDKTGNYEDFEKMLKWKPSIFMPREACRLFLRVLDVREERLQDISEADASSEGMNIFNSYNLKCPAWESINGVEDCIGHKHKRDWDFKNCPLRCKFHLIWDSLNADRGYGWDTNPLVKVITFERAK